MNKALGIDIGGTKISYALINKNGEFESCSNRTCNYKKQTNTPSEIQD